MSELEDYCVKDEYPIPDVVLTLKKAKSTKSGERIAQQIVSLLKNGCELSLDFRVEFHDRSQRFAIYVKASNETLKEGAKLCHLDGKNDDFSGMERAMVVRQLLGRIRSRYKIELDIPGPDSNEVESSKKKSIPEERAILPYLESLGLLKAVFPLHEPDKLALLRIIWVFAPFNPQPLEKIHVYFGMEIALYFAWLGHFTLALCAPALIGLLMFFYGDTTIGADIDISNKEHNSATLSDVCYLAFALFNCFWSVAFLETWKRRQAELVYRWGTTDSGKDSLLVEEPRMAFKGKQFRANPVTGKPEPFAPVWRTRLIRYAITYPITLICVLLLFSSLFAMLRLKDHIEQSSTKEDLSLYIHLPMVAQALILILAESLYRKLALFFNDLENYRTDEEYENFLVTKITLFQCVSAFGPPLYIAFWLGDMRKLGESLAALLITRQITQNFAEIALPMLTNWSRIWHSGSKINSLKSMIAKRKMPNLLEMSVGEKDPQIRKRRNIGDPDHIESEVQLKEEHFDENELIHRIEDESLMEPYTRPLDDYLEMFIQFGYVVLFAPAFPLAAFCALINNFIEIRVDAFKLCTAQQRPFGRNVNGIGAWQKAMELMCTAGVIVNCALIAQSGIVARFWPGLSSAEQILLVVLLEHLVMGARVALDFAIPDVPCWIRVERAKSEYKRQLSIDEKPLLASEQFFSLK